MTKKSIRIICIIALILGIVWGVMKWFFWEPSNIKQGSLVYTLKIPNNIKSFPKWSPWGDPLYALRIADGLKKDTAIVDYHSTLSKLELLEEAKNIGFHCKSEAETGRSLCVKG